MTRRLNEKILGHITALNNSYINRLPQSLGARKIALKIAEYFLMRHVLAQVLNPIFPYRCLVCDHPLRNTFLCRRCCATKEIVGRHGRCIRCFSETFPQNDKGSVCETCRMLHSPLKSQRYLWNYSGKARRLVVAMKFRPSRALTRYCAELLSQRFTKLYGNGIHWDLLVPMPSSPQNYKRRLFNPSREIGIVLAQKMKIPCRSNLIYHRRSVSPQASQLEALRPSNATRSLGIRRKVCGRPRILLVDDVVTSGSTSAVAAGLLLEAGAASVELLSLARSPRWGSNRKHVSQKLNY